MSRRSRRRVNPAVGGLARSSPPIHRRRAASNGGICMKPGYRCLRPDRINIATKIAPNKGSTMKKAIFHLTTALALVAVAGVANAADCKTTVGLVMELTGPAGEYGQ